MKVMEAPEQYLLVNEGYLGAARFNKGAILARIGHQLLYIERPK